MSRPLALVITAVTLGLSSGVGHAASEKAAEVKPAEPFRDCAQCPEMVVIPAGEFMMGSPEEERIRDGVPKDFADREQPRHRVTIGRAFAMSRNEITRGQYAQFVAETRRPDPPTCTVYDDERGGFRASKAGYSWRNPGFQQTDDHPAACIAWIDAYDYAAWLSKKTGKPYRLASEAEWEYAARAGTTTARYWGEASEPACELTNIMTAGTLEKLGWPTFYENRTVCAKRHSFTVPVGSYPPNPFGLNDMIGNIFEWVQDCYHPNYEGAPSDGSAWEEARCDMRLPKGGSFHSAHWLARAAFHGGPVPPDNRPVASGIRVVRDLQSEVAARR